MKPLAIFFNIAGPIKNSEYGWVHQLEIGITTKDNKKPESTCVILKTDSMAEAIQTTCDMVKKYVSQHYLKQAGNGKPPENIIKLEK